MAPLEFSLLFDQLPTPTMVVDRAFRCVAANRAYLQLTHRQLDELLGRNVFEVFTNNPESSALVRASFERVLATEIPDEIAAVATANGRVWSARQAPFFGSTGEVELIIQETVELTQSVGSSRDLESVVERALRVQANAVHLGVELRELREAEQVARVAAARRRFLIEAMPVQVWTATAEGQLDFVSNRVVSYFQRSAEQILGDGWLAVLHPDDVEAVVARWTRALETGDPYDVEFRLRRSDGDYRWHLGRANAERSADGQVVTWVGTNTDIHDAKVALAELTLRSQYEQHLIGIVSHDLRNPLSAVSLATTLLLQRPLDPVTHKLITKIASATQRATRLVNDLLDFAKARIGSTIPVNPTPTKLQDIVETVVGEFDLLAPGRVIQTGQVSSEENGFWDPDRLAQVLSNLVINALQHGTPGTPIYLESQLTQSEALLSVVNQGHGILPHEISTLFEPYRRASTAAAARGSLGLGLYIAREVIVAHGGTIEVESSADALTRFTIRLPRLAAASPS